MQRFIYGEPYIDVLLKWRIQHNLQGSRDTIEDQQISTSKIFQGTLDR